MYMLLIISSTLYKNVLLKVPPSDWVEPTCAGKRKRAPVEYIDDSDRKILNPRKKRMISFPRRYYLKQAYRKAMRVAHQKRYAVAGKRKSLIVMRVRRHWRLMADRVATLERHRQLLFGWRENPWQCYIEHAREVAGACCIEYARKVASADYLIESDEGYDSMRSHDDNNGVQDCTSSSLSSEIQSLSGAKDFVACTQVDREVGVFEIQDRSALSQHDDTAGSANSATIISQNTTDMIKSLRKEATQRRKMKHRRSGQRQRKTHFNSSSFADYDNGDEPRKRGRFYRQ